MRPRTVVAGFLALLAAFAVVILINSHGRSLSVADSYSGDDDDRPIGINPFEDEYPDPPPVAEVDEMTYNFGRMAVGNKQTHVFVVRNAGAGDLKLARGPSSCKCTVGTVGRDVVPPGETAEIEVEWEALAPEVAFEKYATVFTNDRSNPELRLVIEGMLCEWTQVFPSNTWTNTTVLENEETPFEFIITSQLAEAFDITAVESSSDLILVGDEDVAPLSEEELGQFQSALAGYRITGSIRPGFPIGDIRESLLVSTDLEQEPEIRLWIASQRMGPFTVVGPGWQASLKLLQLGRFEAAEGRSRRFSFFVDRDRDGFEFTGVTVDPPVIDVTWSEDETFEAENRRRFYVDVAAPPGMTPTRYVREEPIHVTLTTNDAEIHEWTFFVSLHAN